MVAYIILFFFICGAKSLKTWIPNTCVNNTLNWDKQDLPKHCDNLIFPYKSDVETIWDIRNISISGLSLPGTGDLILTDKIIIILKSKNNCTQVRDLKYTRTNVNGWLDPDNWQTENETEWLPHLERVPCSGETIYFPSGNTFAIQLPSILLPVGKIHLDHLIFDVYKWKDFLNSEMGLGFFKGPLDLRARLWRENSDCNYKKKCKCVSSPYTIRNGMYKSVSSNIYKEAVCLYVKPKCKPVNCYSPVIPDGHCCGICGAVIKIEDKSEKGLDLEEIKTKIKKELYQNQLDDQLKIYVGRTLDENIQVVILPENSDAAIESHYFVNVINNNIIGKKTFGRIITSHFSGLSLKKYLFNSISGIIFGTFFAVILFFGVVFYLYIIFPKKNLSMHKPFIFARFNSTESEGSENLEIGVEPEPSQAFDNPMYSPGPSKFKKDLEKQIKEDKDTQEYSNPTYTNIEESKESEKFSAFKDEEEKKNLTKDILEFNEIKL